MVSEYAKHMIEENSRLFTEANALVIAKTAQGCQIFIPCNFDDFQEAEKFKLILQAALDEGKNNEKI